MRLPSETFVIFCGGARRTFIFTLCRPRLRLVIEGDQRTAAREVYLKSLSRRSGFTASLARPSGAITPFAIHPHPPLRALFPMPRLVGRGRRRFCDVLPRLPMILHAIPIPVARFPNIGWRRSGWRRFDLRRRWRAGCEDDWRRYR